MRSAETTRAMRAVLAACAAALAGCALMPAPQAPATAPAAATPAVPAQVAAAPLPAQLPVDANAQRLFDEARRALAAGRTEQAERAFKALTRSHPDLGGPHANLGLIYRRAGKLDDAIAALQEAVRVSPRQPVYFNQLGIAYRHKGEFTKARAAYEQAIALDANYAEPHLNLGILHDLYLGEAQRALELYDRYLALAGSDATVAKWVVDLKNRKPAPVQVSRKEKE